MVARQLKTQPTDSFVHIIIFLTIVGGLLNTQIFNPTKDKFYAICIMRMDARKYALTNYIYFLSKILVGFLPFSLIFGFLCGMNILACLAIPTFVVSVKLCFSAYSLLKTKKTNKSKNENKISPLLWITTAALLLAAFFPPYLGYVINEGIFTILTFIMIIPGVFSIRYILLFDEYRWVYKELLKPDYFAIITSKTYVTEMQRLTMNKKISVKPNQRQVWLSIF